MGSFRNAIIVCTFQVPMLHLEFGFNKCEFIFLISGSGLLLWCSLSISFVIILVKQNTVSDITVQFIVDSMTVGFPA